MHEVKHTIRMFGDEATIAIQYEGARTAGVRTISTKYPRCRKLIEAVDRQIKAGKPILEQQWNVIAMLDLLTEMLDAQDALHAPKAVESAA